MSDPVSADVEAVKGREAERQRAAREVDVVALRALLHDDLAYIHASARRDTKESYVDSIVSGRISYRRFDCVEAEYSLLTDSVARVTGRMRTELVAHGVPRTIDVLFLAVWLRNPADYNWQMSAWQSTFADARVA